MRENLHFEAEEETIFVTAKKLLSINCLQELVIEMTELRIKLMAPHTAEIAINSVKSFSKAPLSRLVLW